MVGAHRTKKEQQYKKKAYNDMQRCANRNAMAIYQEKPYYMQAPYVKGKTVFEDITESPQSLAEFIYHNQIKFYSVSEVLLFLKRQSGGK